jgi:hypothetical protein
MSTAKKPQYELIVPAFFLGIAVSILAMICVDLAKCQWADTLREVIRQEIKESRK